MGSYEKYLNFKGMFIIGARSHFLVSWRVRMKSLHVGKHVRVLNGPWINKVVKLTSKTKLGRFWVFTAQDDNGDTATFRSSDLGNMHHFNNCVVAKAAITADNDAGGEAMSIEDETDDISLTAVQPAVVAGEEQTDQIITHG